MMAAEKIQQLRKELKHWESAFYVVHQRKPEKKDIAEAPKEIKEKYQIYFKMKAMDQEIGEKELQLKQSLKESQMESRVWGTEFNKKPDTKNGFEVVAKQSSTPRASLDKLGAKLFKTFASKESSLCGKSRTVTEKCADSLNPTSEIIHDVKKDSSSLQASEIIEESIIDSGNFGDGNDVSEVERFSDSSKEKSCWDSQGDIVKGELFKGAKKLFSSKAATSRSLSHQIQKPRLSYLSVNLPVSFRDVSDSDGEICQKDIQEASGYRSSRGDDLKVCSDIYNESAGKETLQNVGSILQDDCVSGAAFERRGVNNSTNNLLTSQNNVCEKIQDENNCDSQEHFNNNTEIFNECFQKSQHSKNASDITSQVYHKRDKTKSYPKSTKLKNTAAFSGHIENTLPITSSPLPSSTDPGDSHFKSDLSSQNCSDHSIQASKYETLASSSIMIAKTEPKVCSTAYAVRNRATVRSSKSTRNECSVNVKTLMVDDSETNIALPKNGRQGKRKRMQESEGYIGDVMDDSTSEKNTLDFVDVDEPAVVIENKVQLYKTSRSKKSASSLSENYVCLNMKRKGYRRKGAGMTGPQLRRKQWKAKMAARSKSFGSNKCFKCGQEGHWANKCKGQADNSDRNPMDINDLPVEESEFPSLREAALMSRGIKDKEAEAETIKDSNDITDIEATIVRESWESEAPPTSTITFADRVKDFKVEMKQALSLFGFSSFRLGQEDSICRILQGLSTLVVLSTGGGKSLCYQLPAYLYAKHLGYLTLVISPLVSLMEDQITGLPPGVSGACLHSGMAPAQREKVIASMKEGKVHFLLVSPEAIVERGGSSQGSFPPPGRIPPIAFACIDEAHCLSEWSHNFRPSYLRLCKVLRKCYKVNCFLGLTATATKSTAEDVARHLGIVDPERATIRGASVPNNLVLSVSRDDNKDEALINLLKGERFKSSESILIYCSRREHTERVATLIRTSMQTSVDLNESYQPSAKKRREAKTFDPASWTVESYHAGLTAAKRRTVQKAFMTGKLRVVVATVAFGMGLDKANVRVVIHYNIAKSFESYVQEIGRAGRDGQLAHCHVFLDSQDKDICELRRHTYANSVDRITLKKFISRVFKPCRCQEIYKHSEGQGTAKDSVLTQKSSPSVVNVCGGHERAMSIQETVQLLDVREEGISTLLSYLELHPDGWVENLNHVYIHCSLKCYQGPRQLMSVAKKFPPVAVAIAKQKLEGKHFSDCSQLDFDVIDVCDSMGWNSGTVKRELISLQWDTGSVAVRKTGVCVELSDLAFHYRSRGDLTPNQIDQVLDFLYSRTRQQEKAELDQLHLLSTALRSVSHKNYWMCSDDVDVARSDKLKEMLRKYFENEDVGLEMTADEAQTRAKLEADSNTLAQLCGDIRQFVSLYRQDHNLTGRAIARIFHGIASPNFPAETWGRVRRFWRSYLNVDFSLILKEATQIIVALK